MGSERTPPECEFVDEARSVFEWRFDQARRCGLTKIEARLFAINGQDIEQMRKIASTPCPRRILADIVT